MEVNGYGGERTMIVYVDHRIDTRQRLCKDLKYDKNKRQKCTQENNMHNMTKKT